MAVITLTSDMGLKDFYVASVKGAIYSQVPDVKIVDISHQVKPFNIQQAAFVIGHCWFDFPPGTIHIIGVDPDITEERHHLIVKYKDHYFIGADNGIFKLLFESVPDEIFELNITQDTDENTFPTKNLFVKAACHLARGGTPEVIGRKIESLKDAEVIRPVVEEGVIKGSVIYIDAYGNAITNITRELFNKVGKDRDFTIMFKRATYDIRKIHNNYNDVGDGQKVALFGASKLLEIAINKGAPGNGGGADSLFGLKLNDVIRVEFNVDKNR